MQLLEREPALASLASYAQDAQQGDGRLVLVAGEPGVGKSALVERLQADLPEARWSWGACDGLFTPRPLGPLFDLAARLGGELQELCRAGAARDELFGALLRQVSEPRTLDVVVIEDIHWADEATVDLLRFLGRRLRDAAGAAGRHLPRRGPDRERPASRRPGGDRPAAADPAHRAHAAVRGRGADPGRRERPRCGRAVPADGRKPVLRHRGDPGRDERAPGGGTRRGAGARRPAERQIPRRAGRRGADRHPRRAGPAEFRHGLLAVGRRRAPHFGAARRGWPVAEVPARDRPAGGRAGDPGAPPPRHPRPDPRRPGLARV